MAGSLASATSTRVDSASKHIIPCKVNTDYMASLVGDNVDNAMRELQQNKMKYCMHKDDVVIGLGRPLYGSSLNNTKKKAYPSVVVTLAGMQKAARKWIATNNFLVDDYTKFSRMKNMFFKILDDKRDDAALQAEVAAGHITQDYMDAVKTARKEGNKKESIKSQIGHMLEMKFVGISLGLAYAHPHSGDTVASVMVGGLRTILNGHFQVHTNDLLMFYWDDELPLFEESGGRRNRDTLTLAAAPPAVGRPQESYTKMMEWIFEDKLQGDSNAVARGLSKASWEKKAFYAMGQGTYPAGPDGQGAHKGKIGVALIKPYVVSRYPDPVTGAPQHFPMDKLRIFGKAISNAQPFEMLDVMLSRQAI